MEPAGRVAVVTGASAGVGRAAVRALAARGWAIGVIARGSDALKATAAEVEDAGGAALAVPTDVAVPEQVETAADAVERKLGPIELWVNDAMVSVFGRFADVTPRDFARVTEVTYLGTVNGTRAALSRMLPRDRGTVVQVGSALAERSIPLQSAYCGAKHAVQGFTESVRTELMHERSNVRICTVHLPALNTPQFDWVRSLLPRRPKPIPPIAQPEVAAEAIAWIADHPRREMWVGASTVATILANRMAPGLLDRYLARTGIPWQQDDELEDPERPDNLYEPVAGDPGARGRFNDRASSRSPQLWASRHRRELTAAAALIGTAVSRRLASRNGSRDG